MNVSVFVYADIFQVLDHSTTAGLALEGVFETFSALVAQGPGVFFADGRVERPDDVRERHALVVVQLAQTGLEVVGRNVHDS